MLELEDIRLHCLQKPGVTEDFPFGPETLVFRVMGKLFLLTNLENTPAAINLKCEPELALELREQYACVKPGYHMNKKHWNTVTLDGTVQSAKIFEWIDTSYKLVAQGLSKALRDQLSRSELR